VYDPKTNVWSSIATPPTGNSGVPTPYSAAVTGRDGIIYAITAHPQAYGTSGSGVLAAYSPASNAWTFVASQPGGHYGGEATTGPDGRIYHLGK
jgi:hypothetical protein